MAAVDLGYDSFKGIELLVAQASIERGWQQYRNGFGFFGKGFVPHPGDRTISVDITITSRIHLSNTEIAKQFPGDLEKSDFLEFVMYDIRAGEFVAALDLKYCMASIAPLKRPYLQCRQGAFAERGSVKYDLTVAFHLIGPPIPQRPIVRVRSLPGVYSSWFEANRRRH